jgi:uncharacterized membrane protein YjjB (DUF3815 family)
MVENIMLVVWSFIASFGFGLLFRITGKDLLLAGLGGALTRAVFILCMNLTDHRLIFTLLAAMFAAFYAEYLAVHKKVPSTVFLYPAIIPLIPADLLYYAVNGILTRDFAYFIVNAEKLVLGLSGLCVGFVVASTISFYLRKKG